MLVEKDMLITDEKQIVNIMSKLFASINKKLSLKRPGRKLGNFFPKF